MDKDLNLIQFKKDHQKKIIPTVKNDQKAPNLQFEKNIQGKINTPIKKIAYEKHHSSKNNTNTSTNTKSLKKKEKKKHNKQMQSFRKIFETAKEIEKGDFSSLILPNDLNISDESLYHSLKNLFSGQFIENNGENKAKRRAIYEVLIHLDNIQKKSSQLFNIEQQQDFAWKLYQFGVALKQVQISARKTEPPQNIWGIAQRNLLIDNFSLLIMAAGMIHLNIIMPGMDKEHFHQRIKIAETILLEGELRFRCRWTTPQEAFSETQVGDTSAFLDNAQKVHFPLGQVYGAWVREMIKLIHWYDDSQQSNLAEQEYQKSRQRLLLKMPHFKLFEKVILKNKQALPEDNDFVKEYYMNLESMTGFIKEKPKQDKVDKNDLLLSVKELFFSATEISLAHKEKSNQFFSLIMNGQFFTSDSNLLLEGSFFLTHRCLIELNLKAATSALEQAQIHIKNYSKNQSSNWGEEIDVKFNPYFMAVTKIDFYAKLVTQTEKFLEASLQEQLNQALNWSFLSIEQCPELKSLPITLLTSLLAKNALEFRNINKLCESLAIICKKVQELKEISYSEQEIIRPAIFTILHGCTSTLIKKEQETKISTIAYFIETAENCKFLVASKGQNNIDSRLEKLSNIIKEKQFISETNEILEENKQQRKELKKEKAYGPRLSTVTFFEEEKDEKKEKIKTIKIIVEKELIKYPKIEEKLQYLMFAIKNKKDLEEIMSSLIELGELISQKYKKLGIDNPTSIFRKEFLNWYGQRVEGQKCKLKFYSIKQSLMTYDQEESILFEKSNEQFDFIKLQNTLSFTMKELELLRISIKDIKLEIKKIESNICEIQDEKLKLNISVLKETIPNSVYELKKQLQAISQLLMTVNCVQAGIQALGYDYPIESITGLAAKSILEQAIKRLEKTKLLPKQTKEYLLKAFQEKVNLLSKQCAEISKPTERIRIGATKKSCSIITINKSNGIQLTFFKNGNEKNKPWGFDYVKEQLFDQSVKHTLIPRFEYLSTLWGDINFALKNEKEINKNFLHYLAVKLFIETYFDFSYEDQIVTVNELKSLIEKYSELYESLDDATKQHIQELLTYSEYCEQINNGRAFDVCINFENMMIVGKSLSRYQRYAYFDTLSTLSFTNDINEFNDLCWRVDFLYTNRGTVFSEIKNLPRFEQVKTLSYAFQTCGDILDCFMRLSSFYLDEFHTNLRYLTAMIELFLWDINPLLNDGCDFINAIPEINLNLWNNVYYQLNCMKECLEFVEPTTIILRNDYNPIDEIIKNETTKSTKKSKNIN